MAADHMQHEFVELMPAAIEEGVLYISIAYNTVVHRCCCGCGEKVVTPIGPTDWSITYHGDAVSLYPSIGSWALRCRSHYWLRHGRVEWAPRWSSERIDAGHRADLAAKARHYGDDSGEPRLPPGFAGRIAKLHAWLSRRSGAS